MEISLDNDQWGYYITRNFLKRPIFPDTDVPDKHVVVLKEKQYIEDIDRVVVDTSYFLTEGGYLSPFDKRGISGILGELMFDYMQETGKMPYDSEIGKETKNITTVEFKPDEYDTFYVKIRREDLDGEDPSTFVRRLKPAGDRPKKRGKRSKEATVVETYTVQGSKDTYTVRSLSDGSWDCSCPHYMYRLQGTGVACKHIKEIRE